jgi:hypothetical protein
MRDNTQHLYNNFELRKLLIPIIVEQLLSSLMGTADTMMVSNVGSAAISAVSLVDSINILVIQALSALSAGGAILCSQYLGSQNKKDANRSARQVLFVMVILSVALSAFCLIFRDPLLHVIFGKVERDVMTNSQIYFFFTLLRKSAPSSTILVTPKAGQPTPKCRLFIMPDLTRILPPCYSTTRLQHSVSMPQRISGFIILDGKKKKTPHSGANTA